MEILVRWKILMEKKQVWKNDKGMRYQDLPFLEKLTHTETLWCLMTKEQKNASIRHTNKFYKVKHCIIKFIEIEKCSTFGLRHFLGPIGKWHSGH